MIHQIVISVEKTYTSVEPEAVAPLEITLKAMQNTSPSDCLNNRFKEWEQNDQVGLEFTLPAVITLLTPWMVFGNMDPKIGRTEMIRCKTARQLWERYCDTSPLGDIYRPIQGWWLLVTSFDETTFISPTTLLICVENLRTEVEFDDTLCFHQADFYHRKFPSQLWLQLIAIILCRQAKIHILDQKPTPPKNQ